MMICWKMNLFSSMIDVSYLHNMGLALMIFFKKKNCIQLRWYSTMFQILSKFSIDWLKLSDIKITRKCVVFLDTHLKKSSLQNSDPFRAKHFSFNWTWHSLHCKHFACHVRSSTFNINRSKMSSWHPPHLGIVATTKKNNNPLHSDSDRGKWILFMVDSMSRHHFC